MPDVHVPCHPDSRAVCGVRVPALTSKHHLLLLTGAAQSCCGGPDAQQKVGGGHLQPTGPTAGISAAALQPPCHIIQLRSSHHSALDGPPSSVVATAADGGQWPGSA
jgi:hypothetical protein